MESTVMHFFFLLFSSRHTLEQIPHSLSPFLSWAIKTEGRNARLAIDQTLRSMTVRTTTMMMRGGRQRGSISESREVYCYFRGVFCSPDIAAVEE